MDNKKKRIRDMRVRTIGVNKAAHTKAEISPAARRVGGRNREKRVTIERLQERLDARRAGK